jgi:hypothetical protein
MPKDKKVKSKSKSKKHIKKHSKHKKAKSKSKETIKHSKHKKVKSKHTPSKPRSRIIKNNLGLNVNPFSLKSKNVVSGGNRGRYGNNNDYNGNNDNDNLVEIPESRWKSIPRGTFVKFKSNGTMKPGGYIITQLYGKSGTPNAGLPALQIGIDKGADSKSFVIFFKNIEALYSIGEHREHLETRIDHRDYKETRRDYREHREHKPMVDQEISTSLESVKRDILILKEMSYDEISSLKKSNRKLEERVIHLEEAMRAVGKYIELIG